MSLSVSSFPETPPKLVRQPKWQVTPSQALKSSGRFLGTLLSKRPVPFLKGIGHFAKTHVKGSIIRQRTNVSRSRSKRHPSLSRSSIQSSSIVIDITPISNNDKCFSARSSDVDASSLNPTIEIFLSPTISPAALSTPTVTAAKDIPTISPTDPVKAPYQSSVQSLVGDSLSAHAHETAVQRPVNEHEEVAFDSEPHDSQPPDSELTIPLPIVPVPSAEGRRRSHSASAGVKASATETVPPTRARYNSETAIGLPRLTSMTPTDHPRALSSEGKDTSENAILQPPATGSTHTNTSESTSMKKQRQYRRETISKRARARSGASSKSTGSNKTVELPPLSAHMINMRSAGSRLSANSHRSNTAPPRQPFTLSATALVPKSSLERMDHLQLQAPPHPRPNTSDVAASPRSRSTPSSLVVGPGLSDDDSEQSPLPSSVDRGLWLRLAAVPHAESWDGERQRRLSRPQTAPEAVLMASW